MFDETGPITLSTIGQMCYFSLCLAHPKSLCQPAITPATTQECSSNVLEETSMKTFEKSTSNMYLICWHLYAAPADLHNGCFEM
jgi:hypothetical protein